MLSNLFFNFLSSKLAYFINAKFSLFCFSHQGQLFWYAFLQNVWPWEIAARKEDTLKADSWLLEVCKLCCVGSVEVHKGMKTHCSLVPCEADELQGFRMSCWQQNYLFLFSGFNLNCVETVKTSLSSLGWETMLVHRGVAMSRVRVESKGPVAKFPHK